MKKLRSIGIIAFLVSLLIWVATFILFNHTIWPLVMAINIVTNICWNALLMFYRPNYDGALVFTDYDKKEIWRLVVNGTPDDWPKKDELILKVEKKKEEQDDV